MDAKLVNKNALITGGSTGIGFGIALALAREGANVAIASRERDEESEQLLRDTGVHVCGIAADVSCEAEVSRMVDDAVAEFGGLDLFVNNAARALHQPITKIDTESYRTILDTNLSACLWSTRQVALHMISRASGGAILIVGSTSMYTPGPKEAVYRITKMGLRALNQSLAVELASHGIRVNLLIPGHFHTRMTQGIPPKIGARIKHEIPLRRFGETNECGTAAAFLLSSALAGYITGAELLVDGGLSLRPMFFGSDEELSALNQ